MKDMRSPIMVQSLKNWLLKSITYFNQGNKNLFDRKKIKNDSQVSVLKPDYQSLLKDIINSKTYSE